MVHKIPKDLRKALTASPTAGAMWKDITPLARNEWICWITSGKKVPTSYQTANKIMDHMRVVPPEEKKRKREEKQERRKVLKSKHAGTRRKRKQ